MTFDHGCDGTNPIRGKATINGIIVAQNLMGNHDENSPFASFIVKKGDIFNMDTTFGNGNPNVIKRFYPFRQVLISLLPSQSNDIENDHYLVECKYTPTYWYRVYNDGWKEQGGYFTDIITSEIHSFNFPKSFSNKPLDFLYSDNMEWPNGHILRCYDITSTGFKCNYDTFDSQGTGITVKISYYAIGF